MRYILYIYFQVEGMPKSVTKFSPDIKEPFKTRKELISFYESVKDDTIAKAYYTDTITNKNYSL